MKEKRIPRGVDVRGRIHLVKKDGYAVVILDEEDADATMADAVEVPVSRVRQTAKVTMWSFTALVTRYRGSPRSDLLMKTKAKDNIRLSSGEVMTLGEALDRQKLRLKTVEHWPRNADKPVDRWIAREVDGDLFWEIGQTLYEARSGLRVSAHK